MNVQVRKARAPDWSVLLTWVRAFHAHHAIAEPAGGLEKAVQTLLEDATLGCIWIIEAGSDESGAAERDAENSGIRDGGGDVRERVRPVGYLAVCYGYSIEFGGRDAFIDEFCLEPQSRGQGVGRVALAQVIDATRSAGIRALHLEVAHDNRAAERLYGHLGFEKREHYRLMTLTLADERS